jgi:hypothetical protein
MNLARMIQKRRTQQFANANPAKTANERAPEVASLAKLATLALANPPGSKTSNPAENTVRNEKARTNTWWRIHYPDGESVEVVYSPHATHAQILEWEPGAIKVEPFEPVRQKPEQPISGDEEAQIREWLKEIGETDESIVFDVIEQCNTDARARSSYLMLAQEVVGEGY